MQKFSVVLFIATAIIIGVVLFFVSFSGISDRASKIPVVQQQPTPENVEDSNPGQGSSTPFSATTQPIDPNQEGLAPYPDLPLGPLLPTGSVSIKFVVEHRTALNNRSVTVVGKVVNTLLGEKACPPDRGMCAQPSVFLADSTDSNRNPHYDLKIIVNESEQEKNYPIGKSIEIPITVEGSKVAIIGRKVY